MSIKDIKEGEKVGYSESEELTQDSKIWIVPFWYYEWLNRKLSGKYHVKINWKYAKILGKISMNITTIDLTWIECKVGDRVEIISDDKSNLNSIYNMAKLTNLISYELLTWVNEKIKRIVK
jgi:alanine racemase